MELIKPGTTFDFLGKRKTALTISAIMVVAILVLIPFRVNMGVDFSGGTEIQVRFLQPVTAADVREKVEGAGFTDASVQQFGDKEENSFLVKVERIAILSPEQVESLRESLQKSLAAYGVQEIGFDEDVGDKIDVRTEKPVPPEELRSAVIAAGVPLSGGTESIRDLTRAGQPTYQVLTQGLADKVSSALTAAFGTDKVVVERVEFVGPEVGKELRNRGIMALLLSMGAILVYVAFRFQPKFAPGGVIALIHDTIIVMGFYVVTGREFNLTSIAVLLTIVGYSINDTIVIYDRVREIEAARTGRKLIDVLNQAINETLGRTIITSGLTAISLVGLLVFGVGTLWDFAAAMLVGLIAGTYSTIFISGPFAIWIDDWMKKKEAEKKAAEDAAAALNPAAPRGKRASAHAD